VTGIDDRVIRQREKLLADGVEKLFRGATLKIRAAIAAYQQGIARENHAWQDIAGAAVRMTRGGNRLHCCIAETQLLPVM